ncbi:MAG: hypothetical protein H7177_04920 [Rhizobacter sp.]|nr:hypothetical protein [Bacteriovorax sp.]
MKIPIFEEVLLKGISVNDLQKVVEDSRIGKVPCYVNMTNYSADDLETLIINLEQVILTNALHPRFPYPFYIITSKALKTIIPSVRSVKDLPEHYFKKVKRPNNKELQLLNKLSLKVDKIKNLELYKISQELKDSGDSQRKLYNETKELHFLETLNDMLYVKPKTGTKR